MKEGPRGLIRHMGSFFGVSAATAAIAGVSNIVLGVLLGPDRFGVYAACMLVLIWGRQVHLGLYNAFGKQYPLELGRGEPDRAHAIGDSTYWVSLAGAAVVAAIAIAGALLLPGLSVEYRVGIGILALQLVPDVAWLFSYLHQRVEMRFDTVNRLLVLRKVGGAVVTVTFTAAFGLYGLFAGSLAWGVLSLAILWRMPDAAKFGRSLDPGVTRAMFRLGFPLFAVAMVDVFFVSVGRPLTLALYDGATLGYFSMGMTFANIALLMPQAMRFVLGPAIHAEYGRTGSISSMTPFVLRPTRLLSLGLLAATVMGAVVLEGGILWFAPDFTPAVAMGKILLLSVYLRSMTGTIPYVLFTLDDRRPMFLLRVTSLGVTCLCAVGLQAVRPMGGLEIPVALAAGNLVFAVWMVIYTLSRHLGMGIPASLGYLAELVLPLSVTTGLVVVVTRWVPLAGESPLADLTPAVIQLLVPAIPVVIWGLLLQRRHDLIGLAGEIMRGSRKEATR